MTFQPPPPPPGGTPPTPPPGQWGPPPGGGYPAPQGGFNPSSVNPVDWGIIGAGFLAFIFSFISYYTISVSERGVGGGSDSTSAWHGFFGWFAALAALVGAGLVAMELFAPQVKLPVPTRLAALIAFAVATLCVIIALFTNAYDTTGASGLGFKADSGHGFGYWASLIVIVAGLVMCLMRLQQTGGRLPGALGNLPNIGGSHSPSPGVGGTTYGQPPAAGGYQAPPAQGGYQAPQAPQPGPGGYPPPGSQPPPPPGNYGPPQ